MRIVSNGRINILRKKEEVVTSNTKSKVTFCLVLVLCFHSVLLYSPVISLHLARIVQTQPVGLLVP